MRSRLTVGRHERGIGRFFTGLGFFLQIYHQGLRHGFVHLPAKQAIAVDLLTDLASSELDEQLDD